MMDRSPYAVWYEMFKAGFGFWLLFREGFDWFRANAHVGTWMTLFVAAYQILSVLMAWRFRKIENQHSYASIAVKKQ
jgi:hypothetical protein